MQLSSDVRIPDGLLAANALLAENSHQGFGASTHTLYQGFGVAISSTALGIPGTLYDGRVRCRYTGKERDTESGLDYFGARYYASSMGRWMSPDWSAKEEPVPYSKLDDPQTLNLYGYVGNNPLSRADADGHQEEGAEKDALVEGLNAERPEIRPITRAEAEALGWPVSQITLTPGQQAAQMILHGGSVDGALERDVDRRSGGPLKVHGNTAGNQPAELYEKTDKDGNLEKHGVSQNASKRYSKAEVGEGKVTVTDRGPRKEMLAKERQKVETNPGPKNKEPWAGKQQKP